MSRFSPVGMAHFCPPVDPLARTRMSSRSRSDPPPASSAPRVWVTSPVPNLQAGHWPHDSTNRNREYRQAAWTMQAESSNTANPPAPRPDPACRIESKSSGTSSCPGEMTVLEAPGKTAFTTRPSGGPPANSSTRYCSGDPSGSSNTPSRCTSPQMVKTIVPGAASVPLARSQSGPSARMWGTLAKGLDVVDQRGVVGRGPGEQALDERASHPRQGWASLDHLL